MSKTKEQRRANRKEVRTSKAMARSIEGHSLTIHFDNEDMKQQVIDFAGLMKISPGEFMRSAVLRTMIEMAKRATESKEIYDKEMGTTDTERFDEGDNDGQT